MTNTAVDWKESNCLNPFSQLLYSSFYTQVIISKSPIIINIKEILQITKSTSVSTCWNYPPVVLRDPKTTAIHVEYDYTPYNIPI